MKTRAHITILRLLRCAGLLALLAACGLPATAQAPVPSTTNAASTAENAQMVTRDAQGNVIGTVPNPEASVPLFANTAAEKKASAPSTPMLLFQMAIKLGAVLVLFYVGALIAKKYYLGGARPTAPAVPGQPRAARAVSILESAALGQGRTLSLIAVGTQVFLIGTTAQQITLLGEVTGNPEVQALLARTREHGAPGSLPFQQMLARLIPNAGDAGEQPGGGAR